MTYKQAVQLAVEALKVQRKQYAFDASCVKRFGQLESNMNRSAEIYDRLTEAIRALESQPTLF